jgi:hypothetical protein
MKHLNFAVIILSLALTGCAATPSATSDVPTQTAPAPAASMTTAPSLTPDSIPFGDTATPDASPTATLGLDAWMQMPVIPSISDTAREIYARGLEMGRDPRRFSKAGDCESTTGWYLAEFDNKPATYRLGEQYANLQTTIDYYADSFKRESLAVRRGANTSSMLTALWADPQQCQAGESMLACEYRVHNPSIVIIAVGSNDVVSVDTFEAQMRNIIEFTISEGIVPILSTKADNAEGGHKLNIIIGNLAYEYDIPLWNFWLAIQPLPNHGLQPDGFHLTFGGNLFDDPNRMQNAWPWRNLTALQTLDAARQALEPVTP